MKDFIKRFKKGTHIYISTNFLFISFVLSSVFNGWLLRAFSVKNYFELKPLLADLAVCLIIGAFGYFFKPKQQFKYFFTWSVIITALCITNSVYYSNYISFTSISLCSTMFQLFDVADAVVENVMEIRDCFFIWQPIALIFININLKRNNYFERVTKLEKGKVRALNTIVAALIFFGFFLSMLTGLDVGRLGKQWNREYIVMKFGIYTYHINDIISSIKPRLNPLFGYDENAKIFREYYETKVDLSKKNKYTDMFKDKNMIVIHAESIQQMVIGLEFNDIELTPNLNRLAKEGLYFSNFYAQEEVGTSSDTEFTFNTSLIPSNSGTVFINYWDREFVTIPKMLKDLGYYSFSMHGNNGTYWNRNVVHKQFGYDHFYYHEKDYELDEIIGLGLSDKSFFRQSVPIIKKISEKHDRFYGLMITLTNHTPFSDIVRKKLVDYEVDFKYEQLNEETEKMEIISSPYLEKTKIGNYFKSVHYADEALGQFINDLDEAGLLEETIIVLYGDHDAKLKKGEYNKFYNYDPYTNSLLDEEDTDYRLVDAYELELNKKVPFIIWSKNKKLATEVTKVMGMYDVAPTLGNMFGFKNPYALGNDIFSIDDNVVIFPNGNWVTDKIYYNNQKSEGKLLDPNEPVSLEEIAYYTKKAEESLKVSESIIVYDLIRKSKETMELMEGITE